MYRNKSTLVAVTMLCLLAGSSLAISNCMSEGYDPQTGVLICFNCYSGYYLSSGRTMCLSCSSSCKTCISLSTCSSCNSGYYLSGSSCYSCGAGCSSCTSSSYCQTCNSGYYYVNSTSSCGRCLSNCNSCFNSTTCSSCSFTYEKKTDSSGTDTCNATAGTAVVGFLVIIGIILCIPLIICCFCWASIAQCFGWRTATTINYHSSPNNNSFDPGYYAQPVNPGYQPAPAMGQPFPNQPGNPAYGNSGMPWGR
jgi:hypothetical protein